MKGYSFNTTHIYMIFIGYCIYNKKEIGFCSNGLAFSPIALTTHLNWGGSLYVVDSYIKYIAITKLSVAYLCDTLGFMVFDRLYRLDICISAFKGGGPYHRVYQGYMTSYVDYIALKALISTYCKTGHSISLSIYGIDVYNKKDHSIPSVTNVPSEPILYFVKNGSIVQHSLMILSLVKNGKLYYEYIREYKKGFLLFIGSHISIEYTCRVLVLLLRYMPKY
jgi:hypothetical protein